MSSYSEKLHCEIIKKQAEANFLNLETAIKTYDRNALICGAPAWRYVYHAIHWADQWFFNPMDYEEREFHEKGMEDPNNPCTKEFTDEQLLEYLILVMKKSELYLDSLTDEMLYEKPEKCGFMRIELVLLQFRHISYNTGLINGITAEEKGKLPLYITPNTKYRLEKGLYEE